MEWLPTAKPDVLKDAVLPDSVPLPTETPPSLKVTLPPGVPDPPEGVTVAVKVTDCPNTEGLREEETVVVVPTSPELNVKLAMPVAHEPAPEALMNSFSTQNVVPSLGSMPIPL